MPIVHISKNSVTASEVSKIQSLSYFLDFLEKCINESRKFSRGAINWLRAKHKNWIEEIPSNMIIK